VPGVADLDAQARPGGLPARDRHRALPAVVLDRVGEQVEDDLLEPLAVGPDVALAQSLGWHLQPDAPLVDQGTDQVEGLMQDLGDRHRLDRQRHPARLDAADVQHLVDEVEQVPAPAEDLADAVELLGAELVDLEELSGHSPPQASGHGCC